jgi:hypothetical protein
LTEAHACSDQIWQFPRIFFNFGSQEDARCRNFLL